MSISLQPDTLLQTVGRNVKSRNGEFLGEIAEVSRDENEQYIEYVILKSNRFLKGIERFYAIPASSKFITITDSNKIILQLNKDALYFAKCVAADECPKPDLRNGSAIYELTAAKTKTV